VSGSEKNNFLRKFYWLKIMRDIFFIFFVCLILIKIREKLKFSIGPVELPVTFFRINWFNVLLGILIFLVILFTILINKEKISKFLISIGLTLKNFLKARYLKEEKSDAKYSTLLLEERPITSEDEDALGFKEKIESISSYLLKAVEEGSYVVGIDGEWGSGKSSFLNLLESYFKEKMKNKKAIFIRFNPWSYESKEVLVDRFVKEIENALKSKGWMVPSISRTFKKYLKQLKINVHSFFSVEFKFSKSQKDETILHTQKIKEWLLKENIYTFIFIDDLDRLDKEEALLTLKLLRDLGKWGRSLFLLGYDKEMLRKKIRVDTEKFVDLEIPLRIDRYQVLNWFWGEVKKREELYKEIHKDIENPQESNFYYRYSLELKNKFNELFTDYCNTMRKAKELLNDLIIGLGVKEKVYYPQFLIITLMRRDLPELYNVLAGEFQKLVLFDHHFHDRKDIENALTKIIDYIYPNIDKESERFKKFQEKIEKYLNLLNPQLVKEELKLNIPAIPLERTGLIWHKDNAPLYFAWATPSYIYSPEKFKNLINKLQEYLNKEKHQPEVQGEEYGKTLDKKINELILNELSEGLKNLSLLESFMFRFQESFQSLEDNIRKIFIKKIMEFGRILNEKKIEKTQRNEIWNIVYEKIFEECIYKIETKEELLRIAIENAEDPVILICLYNALKNSINTTNDIKQKQTLNSLLSQVKNRMSKIIFDWSICEWKNIVEIEHIFKIIGDQEKIKKYILELHSKYPECYKEIMEKMKDSQDPFLKDIYNDVYNEVISRGISNNILKNMAKKLIEHEN